MHPQLSDARPSQRLRAGGSATAAANIGTRAVTLADIHVITSPPRALDRPQPPRATSSRDVFDDGAAVAAQPVLSPRDGRPPHKPLPPQPITSPAVSPRHQVTPAHSDVATVGIDLK